MSDDGGRARLVRSGTRVFLYDYDARVRTRLRELKRKDAFLNAVRTLSYESLSNIRHYTELEEKKWKTHFCARPATSPSNVRHYKFFRKNENFPRIRFYATHPPEVAFKHTAL